MREAGPSAAERLSVRASIHADLLVQLADPSAASVIETVAGIIRDSLEDGGKVIFFGNGGSAADAAHLSAEFVGRFRADRRPLASVALGSNLATVTALANDYGYAETVFARELEALGRAGDIAIALSTSGRSPSILSGLEAARAVGVTTVAIVGSEHALGGKADHLIVVPSSETAVIQEIQATIGHVICELAEDLMGFGV